ncbi:type II secretion system GspH family protein [Irregularibacter muris]|uniref:Type II secretion system GspH family protein n=1 Tax=Irregularibacter muris TaxID=1796619 RepID=A0AAE3KZ20_9FIRM|nr:type II secretion system protein [Irregularibacter muris]MCR1897976.1 type II secretion system GspH family protein [Irregularibacter muris]
MIRERGENGGFTLLEVLVSIALIGITAVALMGLFTVSLNNNLASRKSIEHTVYIKNIMEELKQEFTALPPGSRDMHKLVHKANEIQAHYPKSNITIGQKHEGKKLYIITIEIIEANRGEGDKLVSYIYLP